MSRRRDRRRGATPRSPRRPVERDRAEAGGPRAPRDRAAERSPRGPERTAAEGGRLGTLPGQLALLIAVFAATAGVAELAGAANLGVSLGIGQVAFAIALVVLLSRS
jgi:hypothetical protein